MIYHMSKYDRTRNARRRLQNRIGMELLKDPETRSKGANLLRALYRGEPGDRVLQVVVRVLANHGL